MFGSWKRLENIAESASTQDKWRYINHNSLVLMTSCVQQSTAATYSSGWKAWFAFANWLGIDPMLQSRPKEWINDEMAVKSHLPFKTADIVGFITRKFYDEKIAAKTVNNYVSGIRHVFRVLTGDVAFIEHVACRSARTAINLIHAVMNPVANRNKLPFTCEMVVRSVNTLFSGLNPENMVLRTAIVLGYTALMRKSEYLPTSYTDDEGIKHNTSDHFLRGSDIRFVLDQTGSTPQIVLAPEIWAYEWVNIRSVIINVRSAKNDVEGQGHRFCFDARRSITHSLPENVGFCIVWDLYSWARVARPSAFNPFLSFRGQWTLSYDTFTKAVKTVARSFGLNPMRFSSHSLRIGGASALAAANVPDYVIQKLGRWKSLAFLAYLRMSFSAFNKALDVLVDPNNLQTHELSLIHSGL